MSFGWYRRSPSIRVLIVVVTLLTGSLAFFNVIRVISNRQTSSDTDGSDLLPRAPSSAVEASASLLYRLPASVVRVDAQPSSSGSGTGDDARVKLILSVDVSDLADLVHSYRNGFVREPERFPDDGGFVMHNPNLCRQPRRGRLESRPISWIVYVHSSPNHANRRQMLRDTWANLELFKNFEFRVVFLIGQPAFADNELQVSA